jgi:hypothetical protein
MKPRGLTEHRMNLPGRHTVIDDKAETDLGQREVNGVERPPFGSVG